MAKKNRKVLLQTLRDLKSIRPRYSGDISYPFWRRVNALPERSRWRVYQLGCVLQMMENLTIAELEHCEKIRSTSTNVQSK